MQTKSSNDIQGIDISNWKGMVDFNQVKANGYEVVYMKATEGTGYVDPYMNRNYPNAKAVGIKVGFYHFFRCNRDAIAQARHFVNSIGNKSYECKLALDIETTDDQGDNTIVSKCVQFLEEVERLTGTRPCVYTYTSFAKEHLDSRLSNYSVWIAHYGTNTPSQNGIWDRWAGFQYSESGYVPGVPHDEGCDMDVFTEEIFVNGGEYHGRVANENYTGRYTNARVINVKSTLNVRKEANVQGEIIGELNPNERVKINKDVDFEGFYSIYYGETGGFVSKEYIQPDGSGEEKIFYGVVTSKCGLNVRDPEGNIIGCLDTNSTVKISSQHSRDEQWSIYYGNNGGFISKEYVKLT